MKKISYYQEELNRLRELEKVYSILEGKIKKYPPGKIHIVKSPKRIQFYLRTEVGDKSGKYIRKSDIYRISTYLQKKYDCECLQILADEIAGLKMYLGITESFQPRIEGLYSNQEIEIKNHLKPIVKSDKDRIEEWLNIPYTPMPITEEEGSINRTEKGHLVRSKSELNIANALWKFQIPYKYECPLYLQNGRMVHPDFTIYDAKKDKEVYWEHRGMMGDKNYANHAVMKLREYSASGIFLGDNLIITEGTSDSPLGTDEIERVIRHYFL